MLPILLNAPKTKDEWDRFTLHHRTSHDLIRQAIRAQSGTDLPDLVLDPIALDQPKQWLQANQQLHTDMNTVLQLPSIDLEDIDVTQENQLQAWVFLHYQEHRTAEDRLGISS